MLSLQSFSQKDTTQVIVSTQTARLIIKDLLKYDGCQEELKETYIKIAKLEEVLNHSSSLWSRRSASSGTLE